MPHRDDNTTAVPRTRRRILRDGCGLLGGMALGGDALAAAIDAVAQGSGAVGAAGIVPHWIADATGNRSVGKGDRDLALDAKGTRRGLKLAARDGYDHRADLFARGRIDNTDVKALAAAIDHYRANPTDIRKRPVTVGWHYGWFNHSNRKPKNHHVWFKGEGYSSRDPQAEALFNDLKNEFGITVDALSWADPKADGNLNDNLYAGYMQAPNAETRYAALLYESLISLRTQPGDRVDFQRNRVRNWLVQHFRDMARTFMHMRDESAVRLFKVDGRPVIFMYASHTWGTNVDGTGPQYDRIDEAMENAVKSFETIFGSRPFVIGEEATFAEPDSFDEGRRRRSANFDGIFIYHHASSADFIVRGGQNLRGAYVQQVRQVLQATYEARLHRSRFTDQPMLVVPSLAAGFSKRDVPTLHSNRTDYAAFLHEMLALHEGEYMIPAFGSEALADVPPIVSVGSWNEEWEGHAVMPSKFNRTLAPRTKKGFDYVLAIKEAFGWNHYADHGLPLGI